MEALHQPTIRVAAIIAEGVPEKDTKALIAYARANNKVIIGPATVGGVQVGGAGRAPVGARVSLVWCVWEWGGGWLHGECGYSMRYIDTVIPLHSSSHNVHSYYMQLPRCPLAQRLLLLDASCQHSTARRPPSPPSYASLPTPHPAPPPPPRRVPSR